MKRNKPLKDFNKGDVLRAEDLQNLVEHIRALENGENLTVAKPLIKSQSAGRVSLKMHQKPDVIAGGGEYTCAGFIVECDGSGNISVTDSSVSYGGTVDSGFAVTDSTTTAPVSGTRYVWVKVDYSAEDTNNYGTAWQLDDITFESGASMTASSKPVWDDSGETWSTSSGTHYSAWGTIVNRTVTASFGGGIVLVICSIDDIRVIHGCAANL